MLRFSTCIYASQHSNYHKIDNNLCTVAQANTILGVHLTTRCNQCWSGWLFIEPVVSGAKRNKPVYGLQVYSIQSPTFTQFGVWTTLQKPDRFDCWTSQHETRDSFAWSVPDLIKIQLYSE